MASALLLGFGYEVARALLQNESISTFNALGAALVAFAAVATATAPSAWHARSS